MSDSFSPPLLECRGGEGYASPLMESVSIREASAAKLESPVELGQFGRLGPLVGIVLAYEPVDLVRDELAQEVERLVASTLALATVSSSS